MSAKFQIAHDIFLNLMELTARLALSESLSNNNRCRIEVEQITEEVFELRKFGNKILTECEITPILDKVFSLIHYQLGVQVASVFLFSKEGCIERVGISGFDLKGKLISNDWLEKERYSPGESFSGSAAKGTPYGETKWSNSLDLEVKDFKYGNEYIKKLGRLECGISVPLNGTHRTFGTIEVINKATPGKKFNEAEVCWLTVLGGHVAMAFSKLRVREKDKLFSYISKVLADPKYELPKVYSQEDKSNKSSRSVYKIVAEQLVSSLTPYKACIVRLSFDGNSVSVVDAAHADGDKGLNSRHDDARLVGQGIVGKVFRSGEPEIVESIEDRKHDFLNLDWIIEENLKSYICFPLTVLGRTIGTLSLFIGYEYVFDESDIEFLQNVSYLLAAFKVRSDKIKISVDNENKLKQVIHISLEGILASMRGYIDNERYQDAVSLAEAALSMCKEYVSEVDNDELSQQVKATASYLELARDLYKEKSIIQHKSSKSNSAGEKH